MHFCSALKDICIKHSKAIFRKVRNDCYDKVRKFTRCRFAVAVQNFMAKLFKCTYIALGLFVTLAACFKSTYARIKLFLPGY